MSLTGLGVAGLIAGGVGGLIGGIGGAVAANQDPEAISANINPYTEGQYKELGGIQNYYQNLMNQYQSPTYQGNINQVMGSAPELEAMRTAIMGGTEDQLRQTAGLQAQEAMDLAGGQYGAVGAANSGAAYSALARGAATPFSQALSNIYGMRTNVGSNILNQAFGNLGQTNQLGFGQYQTQAGLFNTAMQGRTGLANPAAWPQDSYITGEQTGAGSIGNMFAGLGGLFMGAAPLFEDYGTGDTA